MNFKQLKFQFIDALFEKYFILVYELLVLININYSKINQWSIVWKTTEMSTNKKVKRLCNFNDNWLTNEKYKEFLEKIDENTANCKLCNVSFTVKYDGVYSINSHSKSDKHKNALIG